MLALLPFLSLFFVARLLRNPTNLPPAATLETNWPEKLSWHIVSWLLGAVFLGAALVGITEILSLFHLLDRWAIALFWGALCGAASFALLWQRRKRAIAMLDKNEAGLKKATRHKSATSHENRKSGRNPLGRDGKITLAEIVLLLGICAIMALVAIPALISPPNTWDSMTYHLSRVMHWAANHSVAHYPSHILRQLHMPPFAEYAILHLQLLSGGEYFAGAVQWFAMVGSVAGAFVLAWGMGAGASGSIWAAVFCATIPMLVLQGSSTQNDLVLSFWLVCLAVSLQRADAASYRGKWLWSLAAGLALGLAALTKGTAYLFAPAILFFFCLQMLGGAREARALPALGGMLAVMMMAALLINAGHYARNQRTFGSPLGPLQEDSAGRFQYANAVLGLRPMASNVVRNLALELATPFPAINRGIETAARTMHGWIGMDADDARTTWTNARFQVRARPLGEDSAGSPIHVVFLVVALLIAIVTARRDGNPLPLGWFGALLLAFLAFCTYVRWQPWHCRLLLPLLVLAAPLFAVGFSAFRLRLAGHLLAAALLLSALHPALANQTRPILGERSIFRMPRFAQRFASNPGMFYPTINATRFIRNRPVRQIGLLVARDAWEYPFWVFLRQALGKPINLPHVQVRNASSDAGPSQAGEASGDSLDAILVIQGMGEPELIPESEQWRREFEEGLVEVYLRIR